MTPRPALRVVDPQTGELHENCPGCRELQGQLDGAEKEIRSWRARYSDLKRDDEKAAREHELWPVAVGLFDAWRRYTGHERSKWDATRFWAAEPMIRLYGPVVCERAIAGLAYACFSKPRRNGKGVKRYDEFWRWCKNADAVEHWACEAPAGWQPTLEES